ncbi:interferon-induced very large GTPase 1-like isoform X2 [Artemia franciscana]
MSDLSSLGREATVLLQGNPICRSSAVDLLNRFSGDVELLSGSKFRPEDVLSNISEEEIRHILQNVVSKVKETLLAINAKTSPKDSSFISRLSSGLARYGVNGADDSNLLLKAKAPLLKIPEDIELLGCSLPIVSRTIYSSSREQSKDEVNRFIESGWANGGSFNLSLFSAGIKFVDNSCKSDCSSSNTKLESTVFHKLGIHPVGSFRIPSNQMKLSSEAEAELERIETMPEAEDFLHTFGSHYPRGIHHYGGVVHYSCEIRAKDSCSVSDLASNAEKEFAASLFWQGLGMSFEANVNYKKKNEYQKKLRMAGIQSSEDICLVVYGPQAVPSVALFSELIKKTPEEGIIIDRGDMESLIPVWSLLGTKFENQAELIKNAWMGLTKDVKFKDIQDLRSKYHNIDGELARKNMLPLEDLRRQQKIKPLAQENVVQNAQETEVKSEVEVLTPIMSVRTDLTKQSKLNKPNRVCIHKLTKQQSREESLVSTFIIDCPRDLSNISYRLLHRLELKYCNLPDEESNDFVESEEDFWPEMEPKIEEQKLNVSNLLSMYSLRDNINVLQLLLESRFAIPICSRDTLELLRITKWLDHTKEDIFLGEDLELPRIAVISEVKSFDSFTRNIMKDLFNLKVSLENTEDSSIEVGQGLVCFGNNDMNKKPCIVIHIRGDFEPYWKFLTKFIDCLIVEDEFISESNKVPHFMSKHSHRKDLPQSITVWAPSLKRAKSKHHPFHFIEGPLDYFIQIQQKLVLEAVFRKTGHHEHSMHSILPFEGSPRSDIDNLRQMYMDISKMTGLENYRSKILILQESFSKEGELREKLKKIELVNDTGSRSVIAEEITDEEQFRFKNNNRNDPLINYFLQGFEKNNIDQIILHLRVIEDAISVNIKKSGIDAQLENLLKQKQYNYLRSSQSSSRGPEFCSQIESKWKEYESAKQKRNYALLSLRHLWREVSLYYSAGQCGDLENLPHLAAACLIAGETLELYDGDANMLNEDWIGAIFENLSSLLPSKRFFVLSVLGEQSSGKSTLLNTMFGIRLATSVGQCTKGLTVTLVKTVNRKEYDYVVILDTEGVRSPEMTGIHGCTKRDNKIAALSILQSDAVILTINGEQNNALKAILPIVALAYKGSKLAEQRGGLLSCKIFAAYNKVEINEGTRNRLLNNFTQLSDTLVQSLATVNSHQDSNFHTSISFPPMFLNDGDIRVFGCNKNGNPPSDVPNEDFSMEIIDFREYIHEQVVNQTGWISRNIEEIHEYLLLVLECLNTSNFDLSFETVCDRYVYSGIEKEYLNLRKSYIITFEEQFELLKDKYKKENSSVISDQNTLLSKAVDDLKLVMRPHTKKFKEQVEKIFKNEKNQKFEINYRSKVKDTISRQTSQWCDGLQLFLRNLLFFDKKVEEYEKEMTDKIMKVFRDKSLQAIPKTKLIEEFDSYFNEIVQKAQKENPPMDIKDAVLKAYKNNQTIESLELDLLSDKENNTGQNGLSASKWTWQKAKKMIGLASQSESNKKKMEKAVDSIIVSITTGRKCYSELVVYDVISEVENF